MLLGPARSHLLGQTAVEHFSVSKPLRSSDEIVSLPRERPVISTSNLPMHPDRCCPRTRSRARKNHHGGVRSGVATLNFRVLWTGQFE